MVCVRACALCNQQKMVANSQFSLCQECVNKIVKYEKKRRKRIKKDEKKGIIRFG